MQLARLAVKAEMEEGAVYLPQRGSGVKPRKILAILHFELLKTSLSWLCDNERWRKLTTKINAFESLGSRVWNLTPVCRLQNSSGYGTVCTTQSRPPTFKKRQIYDLKQFSKNFEKNARKLRQSASSADTSAFTKPKLLLNSNVSALIKWWCGAAM